MSEQKTLGLLMFGLDEETYEMVRKVARKRQMKIPDVISDAFKECGDKHLTPDELKETYKDQRKLLME